MPNTRRNPADIAEMKRLYALDYSLRQIGDIFGISQGLVSHYVGRQGKRSGRKKGWTDRRTPPPAAPKRSKKENKKAGK